MSGKMFEIRPNFVAPLEFPLECPCQFINPPIKIIQICPDFFSDFAIIPYCSPIVALLLPIDLQEQSGPLV